MTSLCLIALFTLLSGIGDALGFVYAGKVWQNGHFILMNAFKSALAFQLGAVMYWCAVRHLNDQGIVDAEVQTLFWFAATIIGIALMSGRFLRWGPTEQATAAIVLLGIASLMLRTAR